MGKGIIRANLGEGRYTVEVVLDQARIDAQMTALGDTLAAMTATISEAESDLEGLTEADGEAYHRARIRLDRLLARKASARASIRRLESWKISPLLLDAWCADLTDDLSIGDEVATVEVPGQRGTVQIRPAFADRAAYDRARDGQLQPAAGGTPSNVTYNWMFLPGWLKWRPFARVGTLTSVDKDAHTGSVALDPAIADQTLAKNLNINQSATLPNIPIRYMDCDAKPFEERDRVIVLFREQTWATAEIVGFEEWPKPCISDAWETWDEGFRGLHDWQGTWSMHEPDPTCLNYLSYDGRDEQRNYNEFWGDRKYYDWGEREYRYDWRTHVYGPMEPDSDFTTWFVNDDLGELVFQTPFPDTYPRPVFEHISGGPSDKYDFQFGSKIPSSRITLNWTATETDLETDPNADPLIKTLETPWFSLKMPLLQKLSWNLEPWSYPYTFNDGYQPYPLHSKSFMGGWGCNFWIKFSAPPGIAGSCTFYVLSDLFWSKYSAKFAAGGIPLTSDEPPDWIREFPMPGLPRWNEIDGEKVYTPYDETENWAETYKWEPRFINGQKVWNFPAHGDEIHLISDPLSETADGRLNTIFDLRDYFTWDIGEIEIVIECPGNLRPVWVQIDEIDFLEQLPVANLTPDELTMLQLHNNYRDGIGIQKLRWDVKLEAAARRHAEDLAANLMGGHYGSDGSDPVERIRDSGYFHGNESMYAAFENVSVAGPGFSLEEVFQAWIDSPVHLENIERDYLQDMGYAEAEGVDGNFYRVVCFGAVIA